jgi:hypothetical protein
MADDNDRILKSIERAIDGYHYAVDLEKDPNIAAKRAIDSIQAIMGKPWVPGAAFEKRRRRFAWEDGDLVFEEKEGKGD